MGIIDPAILENAARLMRSRPGMGSCKLQWNPYECVWEFEISYSDPIYCRGRGDDINAAISGAILEWYKLPPFDFDKTEP